MTSIYDIAKLTGMSPSTISLVLNDKGDGARIAKSTQAKIKKIAFELGYIPNISARKLLSSNYINIPEIALIWNTSQSPLFLNSFIGILNNLIEDKTIRDMNITIYPSKETELFKLENVLTSNLLNGIIVSLAVEEDIKYLKKLKIQVPTITLNEVIKKYSSVVINNYEVGKTVADIFIKKGIKTVGVISNRSKNNRIRNDQINGFFDECKNHNLDVLLNYNIDSLDVDELQIGKKAADIILNQTTKPEGIFIQRDSWATRIVNNLRKQDVKIPDQIEIISYGIDNGVTLCEPTITTIRYPMEEISVAAIKTMDKLLRGTKNDIVHYNCKIDIDYRESCTMPKGEI